MLLLHATGESSASWDSLAPVLARPFRVIAVDLRGHDRERRNPPTRSPLLSHPSGFRQDRPLTGPARRVVTADSANHSSRQRRPFSCPHRSACLLLRVGGGGLALGAQRCTAPPPTPRSPPGAHRRDSPRTLLRPTFTVLLGVNHGRLLRDHPGLGHRVRRPPRQPGSVTPLYAVSSFAGLLDGWLYGLHRWRTRPARPGHRRGRQRQRRHHDRLRRRHPGNRRHRARYRRCDRRRARRTPRHHPARTGQDPPSPPANRPICSMITDSAAKPSGESSAAARATSRTPEPRRAVNSSSSASIRRPLASSKK